MITTTVFTVLQFAMFVPSSSATMATVFLVAITAMDIPYVPMEATKETAVSVLPIVVCMHFKTAVNSECERQTTWCRELVATSGLRSL